MRYSGMDDAVEEGGGDAQRAVGSEGGEGLDVERVRLRGRVGRADGGRRGGGGREGEGFEAALYACYDFWLRFFLQ